ncbi:acyloxyacyl hydrolase [Aequorivita echinoideorum]|uniref:Acyloxyacyl hydrolase n=1 Tax=Aequorivita echinoideorum TaxID=1549647 RepID=A0ABS5S3W3_9FLAO|nr:acyloxyacyl hydrolase [Aequorivita echinoideorum]MBT0607901.1 acyloxyacyl hydrolase [Aequorivita echinoideorum]
MKKLPIVFLFLLPIFGFSQAEIDWKKNAMVFTPEILLGITAPSNFGFPDTDLQKQLILGFGRDHSNNPQEWAYRLKRPKTGLSFGYTDFGNMDSLGVALTVLPYIEFKGFGMDNFTVVAGMGASYFSEKYHPENNPNNKAVTTTLTWAFRLFFKYRIFSSEKIDWRAGVGFAHHSNGHTRLPNQGYNSMVFGVSADIKNYVKDASVEAGDVSYTGENFYENSVYEYYSFRGGLGKNAFAIAFNDKKDVYTIAGEYGRVYNKTYKVGIGFYYRFYQHYYDYIQRNESLVQDGREFENYGSAPFWYATNFGISVQGEILLNQVGMEFQVGYNLHKPAYKIDWRINEGWDNTPREIPESWMLGEYDFKFKRKYRIATRLGLKYYLIGTEKLPENNFYVSANINANWGQADFSELSLGYIHNFEIRKRK